jgi:signal transduction histidine kinase
MRRKNTSVKSKRAVQKTDDADVIQLRRRLQELEESVKLKDDIISAVPLIIVVVNDKLEVVSFNKQFCEFFKINPDKASGINFCRAIRCSRQSRECGIKQCLTNNTEFQNTFEQGNTVAMFEGDKIMKFHVSKLVYARNRYLFVIDDLTQRKLLERQLLVSDRLVAMGKLAASIAHEINNPLQGIMTHLEIIRSSLPADYKEKESCDFVDYNIRQIRDIVKQLLDIYRSSNKSKSAIDINALIHKVQSIVDNQMRVKGIKFELKLDKRDPVIMGWEHQLHQVLLNLFLNALDNTLKGGRITVTSILEKEALYIHVRDTGAGIEKNDIGHIFEPFYSAKKVSGVGLGLFVCQGLIRNHKGKITVRSEVGRGSVFTLSLPRK